MTEPTTRVAVTVRMSPLVPGGLAALATAAGVGAGFIVAPVVRWLLATVDSAPGPLRLLATLPTGWAVLATGVLGLVAGVFLAGAAQEESPEVTVDGDHVQIACGGHARWIERADLTAVLRDGVDLVLLDGRDTEVARQMVSDLPAGRLRAAFTERGYPWREEPGYGTRFAPWIDGRPGLDGAVHDLLRARGQAVESKDRAQVTELDERLRAHGVVVRDRRGRQEVRVAG
jgi:hypothetical protein